MILIIIFNEEDLSSIQKRDPEILEKIYKEYKNKIYSFLIIKTNGNPDIANDVLSETFCSLIATVPRLKNLKNLRSFIFQIASRRLNDYFRKEYHDQREIKNAKKEDFINNNIVEDLHEKQKTLLINLTLNHLKESYRNILHLKYIEDKTQQEISNMLGTSMTMVNSLITRAKKAFEKEFKKIVREFE